LSPWRRIPTVPPGRETQATEAVGNELEAPKVNGFTEGEAIVRQTLTVDSDGDHR
jgi:hypothetical protein